RVTSVAWAEDGKTLFYTVEDAQTKRSDRLLRHVLGVAKDDLVYQEKDERFSVDVYESRDHAYLFLEVGSLTSSEVRYLPANPPRGPWKTAPPPEPAQGT